MTIPSPGADEERGFLAPDPEPACPRCGARLDPPAEAPPLAPIRCPECRRETVIPARIGHWRVIERVAVDEVTAVYRASGGDRDGAVGIRILLPATASQPARAAWFRSATDAVRDLRHPALARVIDAGDADGLPYAVWEIDRREEVARRVATGRSWLTADAIRAVGGAAAGVAALHAAGQAHGGIHPIDLLRDPDGGTVLVPVGPPPPLEFPDREVWNGREYAAPERLRHGHLTPEGDVYALGAVLDRLLLGKLKPTAAIDIDHNRELDCPRDPGHWRGELPHRLCRAIRTATDPAPANRYRSAAAFAEELAAILRVTDPARGIPLRDLVGVTALAAMMVATVFLVRHVRTHSNQYPTGIRGLSDPPGMPTPPLDPSNPADPTNAPPVAIEGAVPDRER